MALAGELLIAQITKLDQMKNRATALEVRIFTQADSSPDPPADVWGPTEFLWL